MNQLSRTLGRWSRYELIVIDELGYVPLAEVGAELLFQVIADRAEKAYAQLEDANLYQSHLERTNFSRADLRGANFQEADLRGAI